MVSVTIEGLLFGRLLAELPVNKKKNLHNRVSALFSTGTPRGIPLFHRASEPPTYRFVECPKIAKLCYISYLDDVK
jgi:hypothetical protein